SLENVDFYRRCSSNYWIVLFLVSLASSSCRRSAKLLAQWQG
ncbi:hypothetical protein RRG08_039777, partial [Elysia crispata]